MFQNSLKEDDARFLAFLSAWVVDRLITALGEDMSNLLPYAKLADQAKTIVNEFKRWSDSGEGWG